MKRQSGYTSSSGFLMHGGRERVQENTKPFAWISFGLVFGVAVVLATYLATAG